MLLKFTKMHGLGNDFIVIDAINQSVRLSADQLRFLADRHFGIGCDQILIVEPAISKTSDFRYRIFNADGGEVAQCGNGARCFAKFVREHGLTAKSEIRVDTDAGQLILEIVEDGDIRVNMGIPRHHPAEIPMNAQNPANNYTVWIDQKEYSFGAVSIGNPHAVIQVEDTATVPVHQIGPFIESHSLFPERVNVGFMQILNPHHAKLRVFERGSGETLACGSGACAAAVIGIEWQQLASPVQVDLPGGVLMINWPGRTHPVVMSGPAITVFEGKIPL